MQQSRERRLFWGKNGTAKTPMRKLFRNEAKEGMSAPSIWDDVGFNQHASQEIESIFGYKAAFETPKPESLIRRILEISTNSGDLVIDSFAGSGTTGSVAHKMNRRWIMVEQGDHAHTLIVPRLKKVIDSADPGGVTEATGWQGGGGFRYFKLAPSLLKKDAWGQWVINDAYNAEMLAEAMCKHNGFTYAPSQDVYWQQGRSTETDFIFTTTRTLTSGELEALNNDVGPERTLLVCCKAFRGKTERFDRLTVQKIPKAVLDRCEFGRDDYSIQIAELPQAEASEAAGEEAPSDAETQARPSGGRRRRTSSQAQIVLPGTEANEE